MSARILVVEDEEALTTLLRYNLDAEGYDVETVARGDDADTRLKERVPDLIVLDFLMPGLNGIEAAREIVRASPNVPIMLCTMYLSPQLLDLAKNAGVTGTLSKSNLGQLIPGIETILSGSTYFSPAS